MTSKDSSIDERRVPARVYSFALLVAALGLSLMFLFGAGVRSAFAATTWSGGTFTYDGRVYPTNLVGATVTFNASPGQPDSYLGNSGGNIMWYSGRWYLIGGHVSGTTYQTPDTGEYWLSEASSVTNPWYIAFNKTQGTNPMLGGFFDANHGWGGSGRTITFAYGSVLGDTTLYSDLPLLYHHDFIRYVVDNSDWRTRYTVSSDSWTPASASFSGDSVTWSIPSSNPSANVTVYYSVDGTTWSRLVTLTNRTGNGSYTISQSGHYRVDFTYSLNGGTAQTQTITLGSYSAPSGSSIVFRDASLTSSSNGEQFVVAHFDNPQPDTVSLQALQDGVWVSLGSLNFGTITSGDQGWWLQHTLESGTDPWTGELRLLATLDGASDFTYPLGYVNDPGDEIQWSGWFGKLGSFVSSFMLTLSTFFAWLPEEVRVVIYLAIFSLVGLGIIQLVKP